MLVCILFVGHFVADFFLQSSGMAKLKKERFRYLLLHCGIYAAVFAVTNYTCLTPRYATYSFLIIILSHFVVDLVRGKIDKSYDNPKCECICFIADQVLHMGIIVGVYYLFELDIHTSIFYECCSGYSNFSSVILYVLLYTMLTFPSAVFMKKLLKMLFRNDIASCEDVNTTKKQNGKVSSKKQKEEARLESPNVGSMIGILERVITSILLLCNQYSAIGLVLTAKSIARFRQLEEKDFAEKYLIGTLSSLLISLAMTMVIKTLL